MEREPFEVLGKWMSRYAMWQLELANQLFIANGGKLGPSEIVYDVDQEIWEYTCENEMDEDDDQYSVTSVSSGSDGDDLEALLPVELEQCVNDLHEDTSAERYKFRKRKLAELTCVAT